jgi:hypothetical protein
MIPPIRLAAVLGVCAALGACGPLYPDYGGGYDPYASYGPGPYASRPSYDGPSYSRSYAAPYYSQPSYYAARPEPRYEPRPERYEPPRYESPRYEPPRYEPPHPEPHAEWRHEERAEPRPEPRYEPRPDPQPGTHAETHAERHDDRGCRHHDACDRDDDGRRR